MADVKKSAFALSSATLMIGKAFVDDVFSLTPDDHSVGMTAEFSISVDSSLNELLNGVAQASVDAKKTNVSSTISGNVYEMTAQNFLYGQGMSGTATQVKRGKLDTQAAGGATSLSIISDPVPGEADSAITVLGDIPAGATLLLQHPDQKDLVFPTVTDAATTGTGPFVASIDNSGVHAIPAGMTFPVGTKVWVVSEVGVGDVEADDLFCVKITGVLSNYDRPVTYIAPKVRMSRGFQVSYNETQYGSMPWEMRPFLLSSGEVASMPRGAEIGTKRTGRLYVGG